MITRLFVGRLPLIKLFKDVEDMECVCSSVVLMAGCESVKCCANARV